MTNEINYLDLCSGIGGFRVAINNLSDLKINFKCILSADIKKDAIDTYNLNFKENNKKVDIYDIIPSDIESFQLLCAGFPCQPFSSAGQKKAFADKRGGLIFKIIEICSYHKPEYILLENVYNLINLENGKYINEIKLSFENIGYFVNYKKLNSCDFGCPQSRERVYILCCKNKNINLNEIETLPKKKLKDVIDSSIFETDIDEKFIKKLLKIHEKKSIFGFKINDKRGGENNIHSWDIDYNGHLENEEKILLNQILLERRKKHWADKKQIKWMDGMPLTFEEIKTFNKNSNLKFMLDNLVDKKYLRLEKPKDLIGGKRFFKESSEIGYNICKGKLSFPISKILDPNSICPTLTATDSHKLGIIIKNKTIRKLTVNEIKKICGFPDTFIIPPHVNYYDLFGNMVTPPVIEKILRLIFQS